MVVAVWGVETVRALGPTDLPRLAAIRIDGSALAAAFGVSLVTGIALGLVPASGFSRLDLSESLKEGARSTAGAPHQRLRRALVVGEVALSLVLVAGAGLMLRTLFGLLTTDPGFDSRNVLVADVFVPRTKYSQDAQRGAFAAQVVERIRALPGVEAVGATSNLPLSNTVMSYAFLMEADSSVHPERAAANPPQANFRAVTPDYLRVMRIPLLRGRGITERDAAGAPDIVVINEAMARKYWPNQDPLGHLIRVARGRQPAWREIVGIVGSVRHEALHEAPRPEMYVPFAQQPMFFFRLAVRTEVEPMRFAAAVRRAVWQIDKDQPVARIRPMTEVVAGSMVETRFYGSLLLAFAIVALVLAAVGIYGVLAYSVARRTREIGTRVALGAKSLDVLRLVLGEGLFLAGFGTAAGLLAAWGLTRFLGKQVHGVTPTDPATFAGAAATLLLVALAASWIPSRRAARVDPIVALRNE
jgi:predicted permease